jgi:hypothetical protein
VLFRGTLGADYEKGKKHASWLFQQNAVFKLYGRYRINFTFDPKQFCKKKLTKNQ